MKQVIVEPSRLSGHIGAPPSKSAAHRAILAAALADAPCTIYNVELSEDISATIDAVKALGAAVDIGSGKLEIAPAQRDKLPRVEINCRESGSTLRFMIPVALARAKEAVFTGSRRLFERPLSVYAEIFDRQGIEYELKDGCFTAKGKLTPGVFNIRGDVSSQFLTGLMYALPLAPRDSEINIIEPLESSGYIDMTLDILKRFGVNVERDGLKFLIKGGQAYKAADFTVEGDYSNAAFYLVLAALGADITVGGLCPGSLQGDRAILAILERMGAKLIIASGGIRIKASKLKGIRLNASQIPDLVPAVAAAACFCEGKTEIVNAARLRLKESDRLSAISETLRALGADIEEKADALVIHGKGGLAGGICDSFNDHRIAMMAGVCGIFSQSGVTITNSDAVKKSNPHFWRHLIKLGGNVVERDME